MTAQQSRKKAVFLLIVLALILLNCPLLAVEDTIPVQQPLEMPSVAGLFFRIIISLIFILVITYVVMKLLKRQNDLQQKQQKSWIRVFDYQGLGPNRGIYLLEMLNDVYLVGVSEGQINILKEIDQNDDYWNDVKDTLEQNQEEILPWGLEKLIKDKLDKFKPFQSKKTKSFQKELGDQLTRSNRLYRQIPQGGNDGE